MQTLLTWFIFSIGIFTSVSQSLHTLPDFSTDDLIDGWYKFEAANIQFDVEVINGKMTQGVILWPDTSKYQGHLQHTTISGRGTYEWPNGIRYEGRFKNNMRHGKGSLILQNNSKWYGKWYENKKNGKGIVFDANGSISKQGVWTNDLLVSNK